MWLPKDERIVLMKYYRSLQTTQECKRYKYLSERVYNATCNLLDRGLIYNIEEHGPDHNMFLATYMCCKEKNLLGFLTNSKEDVAKGDITLRLTLDGLDLALKYQNWFTRTGIWWNEHKGHWIWILLGFVATSIVSFLLGLMSSKTK